MVLKDFTVWNENKFVYSDFRDFSFILFQNVFKLIDMKLNLKYEIILNKYDV